MAGVIAVRSLPNLGNGLQIRQCLHAFGFAMNQKDRFLLLLQNKING